MDLGQFLYDTFISEGLFVVVVAYAISDIIKKATPINNKYIPAIAAVLSAIIAVLVPYISGSIGVKIFKGIVLGWAATGGYETLRNMIPGVGIKKDTSTEDEED